MMVWFDRGLRYIGLKGCWSHSGGRAFITRAARLVHKAVIRCGIFSSQPATLAPDHPALHRWQYRCPTQAGIADLNAASTPNEFECREYPE
jgi:hypothetical protein